jgi:hypothetical protein
MSTDIRKVHFVSLGCPKNRVDTETMLAGCPRPATSSPRTRTTPRSSSSTPAPSSRRPRSRASTPSSTWRACETRASSEAPGHRLPRAALPRGARQGPARGRPLRRDQRPGRRDRDPRRQEARAPERGQPRPPGFDWEAPRFRQLDARLHDLSQESPRAAPTPARSASSPRCAGRSAAAASSPACAEAKRARRPGRGRIQPDRPGPHRLRLRPRRRART